jgi:uncharacterized protein YcsI (UPF0317 family)
MNEDNLKRTSGAAIRAWAAQGKVTGPTAGMAMDYVQANLLILPQALSDDFRLFCARNARPCPLLEVTEAGSPTTTVLAHDADLRTDVPRYCVYRHGRLVEEPTDINSWWRDDLVAFLLGCSFTFERALVDAGIPLRHLAEGRNVAMYRTNLECVPAGPFSGPMVVSMRPLRMEHVAKAERVTARYPRTHGAPVHVGAPEAIGVRSLGVPDYGDSVEIGPEEVPVFWACGVTSQVAALGARPEIVITHKPGHMFVTDLLHTDLKDQ